MALENRRLMVDFGFEKPTDSRLPVGVHLRIGDMHTDEVVVVLDLAPEDFVRLLSGTVLTTDGRVRTQS